MEIEIKWYRSKGAKIGSNVRAFSPIIASEPYLLDVGNNVTISTGVKFSTHDNSISKIIPNKTDIFGRIRIGENCFIGQNVLILPGVELADNIIVGAGSIVTKSFKEEGIIIAGNPAKKINDVNNFAVKAEKFALNTRGISWGERKNYILENERYLIKK